MRRENHCKRRSPRTTRPLGFETCEDRLALSVTAGPSIDLRIEYGSGQHDWLIGFDGRQVDMVAPAPALEGGYTTIEFPEFPVPGDLLPADGLNSSNTPYSESNTPGSPHGGGVEVKANEAWSFGLKPIVIPIDPSPGTSDHEPGGVAQTNPAHVPRMPGGWIALEPILAQGQGRVLDVSGPLFSKQANERLAAETPLGARPAGESLLGGEWARAEVFEMLGAEMDGQPPLPAEEPAGPHERESNAEFGRPISANLREASAAAVAAHHAEHASLLDQATSAYQGLVARLDALAARWFGSGDPATIEEAEQPVAVTHPWKDLTTASVVAVAFAAQRILAAHAQGENDEATRSPVEVRPRSRRLFAWRWSKLRG